MEHNPELIGRIIEWRTKVGKLGNVLLDERWRWSHREVAYNARLCEQAGFIDDEFDLWVDDHSMEIYVGEVTWEGQRELTRRLRVRAALEQ